MQNRTRVFRRSVLVGGVLLALLLISLPLLILAHYSGAQARPGSSQATQAASPTDMLSPTSEAGTPQSYQHVFLIMMENTGYNSLIGNTNAPWLNTVARTYTVMTHAYAEAHPSQPNYLAITSGATQGVQSDATVTVHAHNLVDQLEARGKSWKAYMQSLSAHGNINKLATSMGDYARKHNPFVSYADIQRSPARMARIVDFNQFATDLANRAVPDFAWISPDVCHDMHGRATLNPGDPCGSAQGAIRLGDNFLRSTVAEIMQSSSWTGNSLILITWDEDDTSSDTSSGCCTANPGGGHILTLAIQHGQRAPRSISTPVNHYSLLATLEESWQLGCLGATCDTAQVQPVRELL